MQGDKTLQHKFVAVLHTAGKHMEDSIVAAYVALLIGTVVQHNMVNTFELIRYTQ